jgi:prevent-host-death family protein
MEAEMKKIGIRELRESASEILRQVREDGEEYLVTYHGRVVARLTPVPNADEVDMVDLWSDLDRLAEEIGASWPEGVPATDAVRAIRREL